MVIIGSRADVYEGRADKTAGGLTKTDIICKIMAGKKLYISQKISNRMRDLMKNKTRKPIIKQSSISNSKNISSNCISNEKTKKAVKFNLEANEIRQFRYEELNGQDIEQLQKEMEEENDDDDTSNNQPKEFTIQEIDDQQLDKDLKKLL
jgi:hypothetical protein